LAVLGKPQKPPTTKKVHEPRIYISVETPKYETGVPPLLLQCSIGKVLFNRLKKDKGALWLSILHNSHSMTVPKFAIYTIDSSSHKSYFSMVSTTGVFHKCTVTVNCIRSQFTLKKNTFRKRSLDGSSGVINCRNTEQIIHCTQNVLWTLF
jgi:hypothetical protein